MPDWKKRYLRHIARSTRLSIIGVFVGILAINLTNWAIGSPILPWWFYLCFGIGCVLFWFIAGEIRKLSDRR